MKTRVRNILFFATLAVMLCVLMLVRGNARASRRLIACKGLVVELQSDSGFVSEKDVRKCLLDQYGQYIGKRIDSVNLSRIESILDRRSAVLKSEAWVTEDSLLHISIREREPVVRFDTGAGGYYADDRGFIFPLQEGHTVVVPVVDGSIPLNVPSGYKGELRTVRERQWMSGLLDLLNYIDRSKIADFVKISVNEQGDLVLYPTQGKERFIFGAPDRAKEKFSLIKDYYRYIVPGVEPGHYKSVNVKYRDQIVCRRK